MYDIRNISPILLRAFTKRCHLGLSENAEFRSHRVEDLEIFKWKLELVVWPVFKM